MKIIELFNQFDLGKETIDKISQEIEIHNSKTPGKKVAKLHADENIDRINMHQLPFIGRALGSANSTDYLDRDNHFPLSIDDNAARYAMENLDRFFSREKDFN